MYEKLINEIYQDVKNILNLDEINNFFYIHFCICQYIRNKYLWNNISYRKVFMDHYNNENIDDISYMIFKDVLKKIKVETTF